MGQSILHNNDSLKDLDFWSQECDVFESKEETSRKSPEIWQQRSVRAWRMERGSWSRQGEKSGRTSDGQLRKAKTRFPPQGSLLAQWQNAYLSYEPIILRMCPILTFPSVDEGRKLIEYPLQHSVRTNSDTLSCPWSECTDRTVTGATVIEQMLGTRQKMTISTRYQTAHEWHVLSHLNCHQMENWPLIYILLGKNYHVNI